MAKNKTWVKLSGYLTIVSLVLLFPAFAFAKDTTVNADKIVELTNTKRLENNIRPLTVNPMLVLAAERKAHDMLDKNYWSHYSPSGVTPWHFIEGAGYSYQAAGENLAKGYKSSESTLKAWMLSEKHRENLLSTNFDEVGVAVVTGKLDGKETTIVVQMFGKQKVSISSVVDKAVESIKTATVRMAFGI